MRKTGLYIIFGIIISLTVFVLAGILYFQPQTTVQTEVARPMPPKEVPVSAPPREEPAVQESAVPEEPVSETEAEIQVPPPVTLSMKVTPYIPPVEFVEVKEIAEAEQEVPAEAIETEVEERTQAEEPALQAVETETETEKAMEPVDDLMLPVEADEARAASEPAAPVTVEEPTVPEAEEAAVAPMPALEIEEEPVASEAAAVKDIAPETVIEEEQLEVAEQPETKAPVTAEAAPATQKKAAEVDEASIGKKVPVETVEEYVEDVFTPSAATLWIVKNSMPVLFAPEILVAPEPYQGGEPEFVSPGSFLSTAEDKRRDAVDSLFDALQF